MLPGFTSRREKKDVIHGVFWDRVEIFQETEMQKFFSAQYLGLYVSYCL